MLVFQPRENSSPLLCFGGTSFEPGIDAAIGNRRSSILPEQGKRLSSQLAVVLAVASDSCRIGTGFIFRITGMSRQGTFLASGVGGELETAAGRWCIQTRRFAHELMPSLAYRDIGGG